MRRSKSVYMRARSLGFRSGLYLVVPANCGAQGGPGARFRYIGYYARQAGSKETLLSAEATKKIPPQKQRNAPYPLPPRALVAPPSSQSKQTQKWGTKKVSRPRRDSNPQSSDPKSDAFVGDLNCTQERPEFKAYPLRYEVSGSFSARFLRPLTFFCFLKNLSYSTIVNRKTT